MKKYVRFEFQIQIDQFDNILYKYLKISYNFKKKFLSDLAGCRFVALLNHNYKIIMIQI